MAEALNALGVPPADLAPVRLTRYRPIVERIRATLTIHGTAGQDRLWLWEGVQGEQHPLPLGAPVGQRSLSQRIPAEARVWLMADDWHGNKRNGSDWLFERRVAAVQSVVDGLFPFEYDVVDTHCGWLLCETHHHVLIAVGQPMVDRLQHLAGPIERWAGQVLKPGP